MTIEQRMDRLEAALGKQDALIIELRDAVTVTASLEAKHGRMMKDHAEWLVTQDDALIGFRAEERERGRALDKRISDLVSAIGEFMRRDGDAG